MTSRPRLLLIDDDRKLCRLIAAYLEPLGYDVTAVHTGPEGVERAAEPWQAVILVLMLTARGDEADRIVGLEIGADDYLPKTFSTRELLARLRAVIRRSSTRRGQPAADPPDLLAGPLR